MFKKKKQEPTFTYVDFVGELIKNNGTSQRQGIVRKYLYEATPTDVESIWLGPFCGVINRMIEDFGKAKDEILKISGSGLSQYNDAALTNLSQVLNPTCHWKQQSLALGRAVGIIEQLPTSWTMADLVIRVMRHGNVTSLLGDAYQVAERVARRRPERGLSEAERNDWANHLIAHDGHRHLKLVEGILAPLERKSFDAVA